MPQLKVLICGGGIAGNTLAFCLSKLGHNITVLERHPEIRASGLQVDLRGPGIQVLRRLGLEEAFRARTVPEQGLQLVDAKGKSWGYFPANKSGKGFQSFTTDFEIMRGELCQLLYDVSKERVEYQFGKWVRESSETEAYIEVLLSDGARERFDLVVGADGSGSQMRKMLFGDEACSAVHPIGVYAGYFTIRQPVRQAEEYNATVLICPGHKGIMTRRGDPEKYQAYLLCREKCATRLGNARKGDVEDEKRGLAEVFRGAGWKTEEILRGLADADDFYCERMAVAALDRWSRGRVVLVGDAAYCPTAMTGMGTSCGVTGAYTLAGEIGKYCGNGFNTDECDVVAKDRLTAALTKYEETLRPFITTVQKGIADSDDYMGGLPSSAMGIRLVYIMFWITSLLRLDVLAKWVLREDTKGWQLPEYKVMDHAE
ncbi:hypothetical protein BDV25DRAFT_127105 [Aspergillus avenaceus]|uniref:FAD-binding domain-containing protein n=1 Tax=Aspergillus avenaceus TaxID=36643 RepID=A0A5N6U4U4_ASPAV|nr:hypothetical protein BDV25DRAFT_127105 [Aspergillus avenaceus]